MTRLTASVRVQVEVEGDDTTSDEETVSGDEDEDEGPWMEPSHGAGNLPAIVRRRLVPTVSGGFRLGRGSG